MQVVNDDMDDLFRKAGEKYPLKTGSADWEKVLAGLGDDNALKPASADNKQKRKRRGLWLLLMLPLVLMYITWHHYSATGNKQVAVNNKIKQNNTGHHIERSHIKTSESNHQPDQNNTTINNNANKVSVVKKNDKTEQVITGNFTETNNTKTVKPAEPSTDITNKHKSSHAIVNSNSNKQSHTARMRHKTDTDTAALIYTKPVDKKTTTLPYNKDNKKAEHENAGQSNHESIIADEKNNEAEKQPTETVSRIQNRNTINSSIGSVAEQKQTADTTNRINKTDSAVAKNIDSIGKKSKKIKAQPQLQHGFYAGVLASFDISTVKLQKVKNIGYNFNLLAGYRFSKHVSFESGINWNKKNYYSTGKYFNIQKTGLESDSKVIYINGNCNMLEIPVTFKYDFVQHHNHNFFVAAGLSSYFMKNENYNYRLYHGTDTGGAYDGSRSYKNSGSNWFSVADFSIGYQLYVNKHTALRIEPYLKMPISGIGIGQMPITSTGITVGFTRSF